MSRAYRVEVEVKGVPAGTLASLMAGRFGWKETYVSAHQGIALFQGEGRLYGWKTEAEAHAGIAQALKSLNTSVLVKTKWTRLKELPYSVYGDDVTAFESGKVVAGNMVYENSQDGGVKHPADAQQKRTPLEVKAEAERVREILRAQGKLFEFDVATMDKDELREKIAVVERHRRMREASTEISMERSPQLSPAVKSPRFIWEHIQDY